MITMNRRRSSVKAKLDRVADHIRTSAISCQEAITGQWEINAEGLEAIRNDLEEALALLGYPPPDYTECDVDDD
jgi:hypothetical protein